MGNGGGYIVHKFAGYMADSIAVFYLPSMTRVRAPLFYQSFVLWGVFSSGQLPVPFILCCPIG